MSLHGVEATAVSYLLEKVCEMGEVEEGSWFFTVHELGYIEDWCGVQLRWLL